MSETTTPVEVTVDSLKKEIEVLTNKLESKIRLSAQDKQIILDQISEKKREIEKLTKEEKKITPVVNAPTFSERKQGKHSIFLGNDRVRL